MNREVSAELRNSLSTFVTDLQKTVTDEVNALSSAIVINVEALERVMHTSVIMFEILRATMRVQLKHILMP